MFSTYMNYCYYYYYLFLRAVTNVIFGNLSSFTHSIWLYDLSAQPHRFHITDEVTSPLFPIMFHSSLYFLLTSENILNNRIQPSLFHFSIFLNNRHISPPQNTALSTIYKCPYIYLYSTRFHVMLLYEIIQILFFGTHGISEIDLC
jgi:hypothetical protein